MKPFPLIVLTVATSAWVLADPEATPASRPRLTAQKRSAAEQTSSQASPGAVGAQAPGQAPVMMTPFKVADRSGPVQSKPSTEPEDRPFAWKEGGTIKKREGPTFTTEVKFQYNPEHNVVDILKTSW